MKTKGLSKITVLVLLATLVSVPSTNAAKAPVAGAKCKKLNQVQIHKNKSFKCIKTKKGLVWNKGTPIKSAVAPAPSPTPTPTPTVVVTPTPTPTPATSVVGYTLEQVRANNSSASCWTIIDGFVYNLTQWINSHPGGPGVIRSLCGTDGTASFKAQHENQNSPAQRLNGYLLGPVRK
ncbi:MAG: hypothetical protein RLZZ320_561 [Actinomycetota bacterium]|jgi:cytochrome b involved in lipid metabolism